MKLTFKVPDIHTRLDVLNVAEVSPLVVAKPVSIASDVLERAAHKVRCMQSQVNATA